LILPQAVFEVTAVQLYTEFCTGQLLILCAKRLKFSLQNAERKQAERKGKKTNVFACMD
jgi:hypothetical protein